MQEKSAPVGIDRSGKIQITLPSNVKRVSIYKSGFAAFSLYSPEDGEKWGFIDKSGKVKINPQFRSTGNYSENKCAVANTDGKWGYIDGEGKILINYQFDKAEEFEGGKAVVLSGGKFGVIDESGKFVINPQFEKIICDGKNFLLSQGGKWGWCDKEGKITINPQFDAAYPFNGNKLAAVKSARNWGYIDESGSIKINPQFDEALPFNGNLALVSSARKYGFIGEDGKFVINAQFDAVSDDFVENNLLGKTIYNQVISDYQEPPKSVSTETTMTKEEEKSREENGDATQQTTMTKEEEKSREENGDATQQTPKNLFKVNDPDGYSNLRSTPNGQIIRKVMNTETFEVIGSEQDWKKVKFSDNTIGYIAESRVVPVNPK